MDYLSRRLPSISVLLAITGLLLVIPLASTSYGRWQTASNRVDAAQNATESAARLEVLLRLAPALSAEQVATSIDAGASGQVFGLSPEALQSMGLGLAPSVTDTQAVVDELIVVRDDKSFQDSVLRARSQVSAGGIGALESAAHYRILLSDLEQAIDAELDVLISSATAAGDQGVMRAARVAEAAVSVQLVTGIQSGQWAQLQAAAVLQPTVPEVLAFSANQGVYVDRTKELEAVLIPQSTLADRWTAFTADDEVRQLAQMHQAILRSLVISGVPEAPDQIREVDLTNMDFSVLLQMASELKTGFAASREVEVQLNEIVDLALLDVNAAAETARGEAQSDLQQKLVWTGLSSFLVVGAAFGLATLVARPVRKMADVAGLLSQGRLDSRLPERGPKEIRVGARSFNDALASLQIAEAQAVALAEERLDDAVLQQSAPGELGASLQSAVTQLAHSLAEREEFQKRLAHEASHDNLTNLPNRGAILNYLEAAMDRCNRSSGSIALLFIDLDEFKTINDLYGHYVGDMVLRTISRRIVDVVRGDDLVGRLGGDEFVVISEPNASVDDAVKLGTRILDTINEPIVFEGVTFTPSGSIGIGLTDGLLTADELLRDADTAVYRAKSRGKGSVDVCDEELRTEVQKRASLEHAISEALEKDEFVLYFQQAVDSVTRQGVSLEALIRWDRPGVGMVSPDDFIPVAERSDLILEIDRWVLGKALSQAASWDEDPVLGALSVAVNISGRHLGSGSLCNDVLGELRTHGVRPDRLVLEITETSLLTDLAVAAAELAQLREYGIRIALDDFGTGYMSLTHLRQLPVDIIKIDRSFVAAMDSTDDHSFVKLIVDTARLVGAAVTAEGVETSSQAAKLSDIGADHLQGYFFSRPVDAVATEIAVCQQARTAVLAH